MLLSELNTFDERLTQRNVFVVPFDALEQHGRFAPVGNDDFIQDALLEEVQKALPDVIFLPTIPRSDHHGSTRALGARYRFNQARFIQSFKTSLRA